MPLFHSTHHLVSAACLFVFMLIISQTGATDKAQVKQQSFDIDNIYDDSAFSNYEIHPELTDSVISDENEIDETNDFKFINITENQSYLYNRIKSSKYVNNPYKNLNISQSKLQNEHAAILNLNKFFLMFLKLIFFLLKFALEHQAYSAREETITTSYEPYTQIVFMWTAILKSAISIHTTESAQTTMGK